MKSTWLYRIASILFVLFAIGHTVGFLKFIPPTPEGQAVMAAMNNVQLQPGAAYTYGGFYRGFGLFATVYFVFAAFVAWHLGELARKYPAAVGSLPWIFFCLELVGFALTWKRFPRATGGLFRTRHPLHRLRRLPPTLSAGSDIA